jgi:ribonuclease E
MDRDQATPAGQEHDALEPEHGQNTAEEFAAAPLAEPRLTEAAAEHETSLPSPSSAPEFSQPQAAPSQAAASIAPPEEPAPRRRSTVREPAPSAGNAETSPSPAIPSAASASPPVITEIGDDENAEQPRRRGWWSRRFAGG